MMDYLSKMKFSSFFLFSCGSVVKVDAAREGFQNIVKE